MTFYYLVVIQQHASPDGVELDLGHVDGREHVLEHGGHQLDLSVVAAEAVHDQQRVVLELLLVGDLSLQRGPEGWK